MDLLTRARIIFHLLRWRVTWDKHDLDYRAGDPDNPRFISAREASALIPDGAVVMTSGMAANVRYSIFYWLIKDAFARTGHPRDLTWVAVGAMGSRGRVPGSIEELDTPGIIRRDIVEGCAMKVVIPEGEIPVTPPEVVTGRGFRLRWHEKEEG